ncbi:MAG TPA: GNAT family N-acetyltransferase [Candidatus Merdivicinus faecavium]|nr:GNAT family N-acetyltransferase [Candidatus Merdivicinus faecavium]
MRLEIEQLPKEREAEREQCFDGFWVQERAKFRYIGGQWSWKSAPFSPPWRKTYPVDETGADGRTIFLCRDGIRPAGQITLCRWWNGFACIERIDVAEKYRRRGVGTLLIRRAREWAKEQGCRGLYAETQDTNVPAMRFYEKNGLSIRGIDTMLYYNTPHRGETAVYYYELFEGELSSLIKG